MEDIASVFQPVPSRPAGSGGRKPPGVSGGVRVWGSRVSGPRVFVSKGRLVREKVSENDSLSEGGVGWDIIR